MNQQAIFLFFGLLLRGITTIYAQTAPHLDSPAHQRSVAEFQRALNEEFLNPQESPFSAEERQHFTTLPFYPTSYAYYVEATLVRDSTTQPFAMTTSTARRPLYRKYGELHFVLLGEARRLNVYQNQEGNQPPELADYLFVPFTDLTNGHGSYGGGRYLDLRIPPAGTRILQVDFNRAYNPSCTYSPRYSCPVPPVENRLPVSIPVGVRSDH